MANKLFIILCIITILHHSLPSTSAAPVTDWPTLSYPMGRADDFQDMTAMMGSDDHDLQYDGDDDVTTDGRRSLYWNKRVYYISYGALSANRVPCPPRSGRSYYTHNCYRARGPVHPYTRGCSCISRCRR